jgi:pyrroloquinoline quinone (PQQ) biosynthesis protein C
MSTLAPTDLDARFQQLDATCEAVWAKIKATRFYRAVMDGTIEMPILVRYMIETYFYVRENAKNQAAVVLRLDDSRADYARYCLKHAAEENGHEMMCLHDLKSVGIPVDKIPLNRPLPSTAGFIGFLYTWAAFGNPVGRLGYSYYAEGAHKYMTEGMGKVKNQYGLADHNMTFFVSHAVIDEKHYTEVREAIAKFCVTDQDWADVAYVIECTGTLSAQMLEELYDKGLEGIRFD